MLLCHKREVCKNISSCREQVGSSACSLSPGQIIIFINKSNQPNKTTLKQKEAKVPGKRDLKDQGSALAGAAQWVGAPSCAPKGHGFDSGSEHRPILRVQPPIRARAEGSQLMFLSPFLSKNE